jgi:cobalt/nickel transport system permease protein
MLLQLLDSYNRLDTPVHRLPAWLKLLFAMTGIVAIVVIPAAWWPFFPAWGALLALEAVAARIPARFLLKRMLILEPFVLGVSALVLFQQDGVARFVTVIVRSTLCLLTMLLFSNTTPFPDMLRVLRTARAPELLAGTLELMHRYLFVLVDETERMRRARASRSFTRRRWHWWKTLASIIGLLFVRSVERAERIHAAMCARGWR